MKQSADDVVQIIQEIINGARERKRSDILAQNIYYEMQQRGLINGHRPELWNAWVQDPSKAPHEALSAAIDSAENLLADLRKLRPESLRDVVAEIDYQVSEALHWYVDNAMLYALEKPGFFLFSLDSVFKKKLDILEIATEIVSDFDAGREGEKCKDAWAEKFEAAAALIRARTKPAFDKADD